MKAGELPTTAGVEQFAADARQYLTRLPRQLPSQYLYDALGSALFEAICRLPWYPVTRVETEMLARDVSHALPDDYRTLVELGPGSGAKLAALLSQHDADSWPMTVHLIDVSAAALSHAARTLERFRGISLLAHEASYDQGLAAFSKSRGSGRALALFLGSNIGNFAPSEAHDLIRRIRAALSAGDGLLLGTDLVKPEPCLLRAYDDPLGVTSAFNRNLLVRINTELGASIDVNSFAHRALWNAEKVRVEMHLVSLRSQRVVIPGADLDFFMQEGETIWTESSYKYEPQQVTAMLEDCGFSLSQQWIDDRDRFALSYAVAV